MPLRPLTQTEESDNGLDLNGFTLQFTDGKTYDLDEIIFNRRRDNSKAPIAIKVNSTEYVEAEALQQLTTYILLKYPTATSTNDIPNFQDVLNLYFEREYENLSEAAKIAGEEGELVVDQKQEKLRVKKDDIKNYLLGKERVKSSAPVVNYNRALAVITQGTPDGWTEEDNIESFITQENLMNRIQQLESFIIENELEIPELPSLEE